jgi:hypothetical protein
VVLRKKQCLFPQTELNIFHTRGGVYLLRGTNSMRKYNKSLVAVFKGLTTIKFECCVEGKEFLLRMREAPRYQVFADIRHINRGFHGFAWYLEAKYRFFSSNYATTT